MIAIVVCNGSIEDYSFYKKYFQKAGLVICADGGAGHIRRFGIKPDVLLGDFDSIDQSDFDYLKNVGVEIIKYPVEKDMTDTELAVRLAAQRGFTSVYIIGGTGTRLDHSLSNILLMKLMLDENIDVHVINEHNDISLTRDRVVLEREDDVKISLLPLSERVEGVTTGGLYYPLQNAVLDMGTTWGISNEFAAARAEVSITSGLLLVIRARD